MPRAARRSAAAAGLNRPRPPAARLPLRLWQLALAALAGNLLLHQLPALPAPLSTLALTLAALGLIAVSAQRPSRLAAVGLLAFCWTAFAAERGLTARWPAAADGVDVTLRGWIDSVPQRDAGRTVFSLRVQAAETATPPRRVRLSWYDPAPPLAAGAQLQLVARLRSPRGLANPGGFDYERWLFVEGYDATGYVREGRFGGGTGDGAGEGFGGGLAGAWLRFRAGLAARLDHVLDDPDAAALIIALSLGDRSRFTATHWEVLQRTGTSHLVAVSGLHIGLIAGLAYLILLRGALWLPYRLARQAHTIAAGLCIVPAAGYAALAGFALPTQRALVMVLVAQCLVIAQRRWPAGAALGLALIIVLLIDPLASLTASLWLSFGAVTVLLLTTAAVPAVRGRPQPRALRTGIAGFGRLQLKLTVGLMPFVIWFFGLVSPASLIVNLAAIPVFSLIVVPLSLLTSLLVLVDAAQGMAWLAELAAALSWQALAAAAANPFAAIAVPQPSLVVFAIAVAGVLLFTLRHGLPGRPLALIALVPLLWHPRAGPAPGEFQATVLDVGHGLAVAIATASYRLLYDAGPVYRSGFDAGAEIVAPALAALSPAPLDLVIISHGDSDHAGGLAAILAHFPQARVLAGPDLAAGDADTCRAGQAWERDGVRFSILHPPAGFAPLGNESSCVLRVASAAGVLLLTGDIERRAEARLGSESGIAADVVIVPHHGSATSSTAAFVRQAGARVAVVSAGYGNRWGFPRSEVRRRWEQAGAALHVTGDSGAIELGFERERITVRASAAARRRYWQAERDPVSGALAVAAL